MHLEVWLAAFAFFTELNSFLSANVDFPGFTDTQIKIVDVGACDVNGNNRDAILMSPFAMRDHIYTGIDMMHCHNVDRVILPSDESAWSNMEESLDLVLSTSCLEHDDFFWQTFEQMSRALRPGGMLYIAVPSVFLIHRHPVDNYRFNPDSAFAMAKWANRPGVSQGIHVISSEALPLFNNTNNDILMIFWKEPKLYPAGLIKSYMDKLRDSFSSLNSNISPFIEINRLAPPAGLSLEEERTYKQKYINAASFPSGSPIISQTLVDYLLRHYLEKSPWLRPGYKPLLVPYYGQGVNSVIVPIYLVVYTENNLSLTLRFAVNENAVNNLTALRESLAIFQNYYFGAITDDLLTDIEGYVTQNKGIFLTALFPPLEN
jgi:SAM-dependent methyltransferase